MFLDRNEETNIHPDLIGLTTGDFEDDCIWDTVEMRGISRPTLYKIWNSNLPINRKLSADKNSLPLLLIVRTNYRPGAEVRNLDNNSYVINMDRHNDENVIEPKADFYINIYNFRWLPLYTKLTYNNESAVFKLVKTEKISLNTHISNGTNLVVNTAKIAFIYEPIKHVFLDKNHCWFTIYPHRADRPNLVIIRRLPINISCQSS